MKGGGIKKYSGQAYLLTQHLHVETGLKIAQLEQDGRSQYIELQHQAHDAQIMNEQLKHEMSQCADQLRQVAANNQQDMQRQQHEAHATSANQQDMLRRLHEAQVTNAELMATLHENAQRDMSERTKHQDDITALENRLIKTREEAVQQQAYLTQRFDVQRSQHHNETDLLRQQLATAIDERPSPRTPTRVAVFGTQTAVTYAACNHTQTARTDVNDNGSQTTSTCGNHDAWIAKFDHQTLQGGGGGGDDDGNGGPDGYYIGRDDDGWDEEGEEEEQEEHDEAGTVSSATAPSLEVGWPRTLGRSPERKTASPPKAHGAKGSKQPPQTQHRSGNNGDPHSGGGHNGGGGGHDGGHPAVVVTTAAHHGLHTMTAVVTAAAKAMAKAAAAALPVGLRDPRDTTLARGT